MTTGKLIDIISRGRKARRGNLLAFVDERGHLDIVQPGDDGRNYVALPTIEDFAADDWVLIPEHPHVYYFAHPIWNGGRCACPPGRHGQDVIPAEIVACNVARAMRWLRWIWNETQVAVIAPWLAHVQLLDDRNPEHRERGLRDNAATAARCHGIIWTGGDVSQGMAREADACKAGGGRVVNITGLGYEPPPSVGSTNLTDFSRSDRDYIRQIRNLHLDV